jgi:arylsulfatase A-like enzyme
MKRYLVGMKRYLVAAIIAMAALLAWLVWQPAGPRGDSTRSQPASAFRPNIILIYADDIDCQSLFSVWPGQPVDQIRFPALRRLASNGVTFTNFHVTTPVCGPSRACLLSGQYAHRNGFRTHQSGHPSSNGFSGGYRVFNPEHELGIWMRQAGYHTTFVGKYLHDDFSPGQPGNPTWRSLVPRGWQQFVGTVGGNYLGFGHFGTHQPDLTRVHDQYRTDFEADLVATLIEEDFARRDQPFFLCWAPYAAHMAIDLQQMEAERHQELFADEVPAGVEQAETWQTLQSEPQEMSAIPHYPPDALQRWTGIHRKRLRAMQALDEGVARMLQALDQAGVRDDTLILFTSDQGFSLGQHRHFGKRFPYDRITRVPCIVAGPGVPANQQCDQLLANIDIAPTLIDLANGRRPAGLDGVSFAGLMRNPDQHIQRPGIVLENWDQLWTNGVQVDAAWCSLRTPQHVYTEWASGSFEYYNLLADPEQRHNLYPDLSDEQRCQLKNQLREAREQDGIASPPVLAREFRLPDLYRDTDVLSASFEPVEFAGFVEDDDGIERVDLELYCSNIDGYWDGRSWSKRHATVPARLTMPQGHISRWLWSLDTSAIAFRRDERMNRRDVIVHVIATDVEGNRTRWDNAFEFHMKINDPETWIDDPGPWTDRTQPLRISGRAADNFRLARVQMLVVDLDRELFWDDTSRRWVKEDTLFDVGLTFDPAGERPGHWATWHYDFDGPQEGRIFFCVRAFDEEGNLDHSVPYQIVPFEADTPSGPQAR